MFLINTNKTAGRLAMIDVSGTIICESRPTRGTQECIYEERTYGLIKNRKSPIKDIVNKVILMLTTSAGDSTRVVLQTIVEPRASLRL